MAFPELSLILCEESIEVYMKENEVRGFHCGPSNMTGDLQLCINTTGINSTKIFNRMTRFLEVDGSGYRKNSQNQSRMREVIKTFQECYTTTRELYINFKVLSVEQFFKDQEKPKDDAYVAIIPNNSTIYCTVPRPDDLLLCSSLRVIPNTPRRFIIGAVGKSSDIAMQ